MYAEGKNKGKKLIVVKNAKQEKVAMPALNGRFGASGAVARPKICVNFEVYRPSERQ